MGHFSQRTGHIINSHIISSFSLSCTTLPPAHISKWLKTKKWTTGSSAEIKDIILALCFNIFKKGFLIIQD